MNTITKISAAEARRRFAAARRYRLIRREFSYPNMSKPLTEAQRNWREIERATPTGVYVKGGPTWAVTYFDKGTTYADDAEGRIYMDAETVRLVYELEASA